MIDGWGIVTIVAFVAVVLGILWTAANRSPRRGYQPRGESEGEFVMPKGGSAIMSPCDIPGCGKFLRVGGSHSEDHKAGEEKLATVILNEIEETQRLKPILKPCPFCGAIEHLSATADEEKFWITCDACAMMGPDGKSYDRAAELWNERKES